MDFGDISDIIVGLIVIVSAIWGTVVKSAKEQSGKQHKAQDLTPGRRRVAPAPRPAPARKNAAASHIREEASFAPWPTEPARAPQPLAVETKATPFISGEEGIRATVDADAGTEAELAALNDGPTYAEALLGSSPDDLRRGVIWAEILSPKFRE